MPRRKTIDVVEGEWMPWAKREWLMCCDCSLVHRIEYRWKNGELELRIFRESRSTGAYRRKLIPKKVKDG